MSVPKVVVLSLLLWRAPLALQGASAEQEGPRCESNGECDRSQFCQRRDGECDAAGRCAVRPQVCPDGSDPVCGCDGRTYGSACRAHRAGVNVKAAGECETACSKNAECAESEFCAKLLGDCDGRGSCSPRPEICTAIFDPVCGCDGKVYSNACKAAMAGVSVASLGGECG